MADTALKRRSALDGHWDTGRHGAVGSNRPGITLALRRPLAMVQVDAWSPLKAIESLAIPASTKATENAADQSVLNIGPNRYLVVEPENRDLHAALSGALGDTAALTDQGHARTVWRVSGAALRDLIAKGTTLDVEKLGAGDCTVTALGHFTVILHWREDGSVDIYAARSFAVDLHHWLVESSLEFGLELV